LRWKEDVAFAAKFIIAILAITSIMCFFLWGDPLYWVRIIAGA